MKRFDILVAGEINPDLILTGDVAPEFNQVEKRIDSADLTIGSSTAIFACGAAKLGLKVEFIGICGKDLFGRFMLDEMHACGVDVSGVIVDSNRPTGLSIILIGTKPGDRAILTHPGSIAELQTKDIPDDKLHQARHLHVGSYFLQKALQPGLSALFQRARASGLTTSLDTNWDPDNEWKGLESILPQTDVFLPNENEACAITATHTITEAIDKLCPLCATVAIKQGEKGATACCKGEIVNVPAPKIKVVDTVGAGDTFDAGFLYGWLKGWGLKKTLKLAVAVASLSTRAVGGTASQPDINEAMHYV